MIYGVLDKDGENDVGQLAGSAATGAPIGTWASFEKDYAPNSEWLQGGTTFNPNTYPALAMYLGGNTIPERFDHSRLGEYENITSLIPRGSASTTPLPKEQSYIVPYDGFITISGSVSSYNMVLWVNGHMGVSFYGNNGAWNTPVKKGDYVSVTSGWNIGAIEARYYKHPMFIKATPTSADSDYEGVLNGIRTYVRNSNSYSTEEQPTGGRWIDGKPIYRKVFYLNNPSTNWSRTALDVSNIDWITKREYTARRTNGASVITEYYNHDSDNYEVHLLLENGTLYYYCQCSTALSVMSVTIEYTKTTDSPAT